MIDSSGISEIARQLMPYRGALTAEVLDELVREIPEFSGDARLESLTEASATDNIAAVLHALALGSRLDVIAVPAAGLEQARILAQREVPMTVLLRAYRIGQTRLVEVALEQVRRLGIDPGEVAPPLVRAVSTYVDRISDQVARAYDEERELRVGSKVALRQHWVNELLASDRVDIAQAEAALRYRLDGWHVAVEAWLDPSEDNEGTVGAFDRVVALLRRSVRVSGDPLSVPFDSSQVRVWLPLVGPTPLDPEVLGEELAKTRAPLRLAVGDVRRGLSGFRSTARSASRVKALAVARGPRAPVVLTHADVAPVALVCDDDDAVDQFVEGTLGDLAAADARSAGLRETLLVYLESNRNHQLTASKLHVHRNTVHYRVQQAMEQVGHDLGTDTLNLQLALSICRWRPRT